MCCVLGKCGSVIELMQRVKMDGTPVKKNAFSEFVKAHYASVKNGEKGHADVMKELSVMYQAEKSLVK